MRPDFSLYLITDRKLFADTDSLIAAVEDALMAGVNAVQLREKDLPTRELLDLAYRTREITIKYGAKLFVNDRLDIAMSVEADGVHIGQSGMPVHAVRKVIAHKMMLGVSTHNVQEALTAQEEGADFITFGPLYQTPSKLQYGGPVGIDSLKKVRERLSVPVFGIGGIKLYNIKEVMDSGADGIALISGILGAGNVNAAAKEYLEIINQSCENSDRRKQ